MPVIDEAGFVTAVPVWFGSDNAPLFGLVHVPACAVGAYVLCPPIGNDSRGGYRGLTLIAERLEAAGYLVVRFDYTGTGDSAGGSGDIVDVETWLADIELAIGLARELGAVRVGVVGLRVGALLAAQVARRSEVDRLVLWDPCPTGRYYLREQRLLASVVSGSRQGVVEEPGGAVEIPTMSLTPGLAASLSALEIGGVEGWGTRDIFVLSRPEDARGVALREQLEVEHADAPRITWADAPEQRAYLEGDRPYLPIATIERIARWCTSGPAGEHHGSVGDATLAPDSPSFVPGRPRRAWASAVVAGGESGRLDESGRSVVETPVRLEPGGLFGILTEPFITEPFTTEPSFSGPAGTDRAGTGKAAEDRGTGLAVVFLGFGADRRTGPSRLWVDLARDWARAGARVMRLDLSGMGDSPAAPGARRYRAYPASGARDVATAARYLEPHDPSSVLVVGVCSGAYHAAEAAVLIGSRAVWLVNPAVPFASSLVEAAADLAGEPSRSAVRRAFRAGGKLEAVPSFVGLAHHLVPEPVWWLLDKLGLYTFAIRSYDSLLEHGTETFIVCGQEESVPFLGRGRGALEARLRSGLLHLEVVDELDHALVLASARDEVGARLNDYVRGRHATSVGA